MFIVYRFCSFLLVEMFKRWRDWHHPNVKYNFWNPTPKFDNSTENKSENIIFLGGNVASSDMENARKFCCKKLCRNKAMVLHRRLRWGILENGGLFQVWLEAVWRPGRWFFFPKKIEAGFEMNPAVFPLQQSVGFYDVSLDESLKLWLEGCCTQEVLLFLSCLHDSEMCLRLFSVRVVLEIWFFYTGSSWTTWCFFFST